jgi:RNA polymerase primary sigma factor
MRQLRIIKQVTNRETVSLEKYLSEIAKVELLNLDQEVELIQKIRTGDHKALERLTKANLRFVVSVSKQYQNQGLTLGDLINEGNLGLIKAAHKFDETRGFKFISYAVWWIRQSILQALAENARIVRLPLNRIGAISKIRKVYDKLEQEFEREPSSKELSDILNIDEGDIREALRTNKRHVSMDAPLGDEDESNMLDFMESDGNDRPDEELIRESLRRDLERALNTLSKKESQIIHDFFGLNSKTPMTMEELSIKYDLSQERIRQIKEKGLRRLKHTSRSNVLKTYLG